MPLLSLREHQMRLNEIVEVVDQTEGLPDAENILWVDDVRSPQSFEIGKFTIARNYNDAIKALNTEQFDRVYLDHDLGDFSGPERREMTGYDVLMNMVQAKMDGKPVPKKVSLLTANPVARQRMQGVIDKYFTR